MASFNLPFFTLVTEFNPTTGENEGVNSFFEAGLFSDLDDDDPFFQVNEPVVVFFSAGLRYSGTFLGVANIEGILRPVFYVDGFDSNMVLGVGLDPTTYPNLASVGVQTQSFQECFLAGTHIATPLGETRVEALRIGDLVIAHDGRCVPVKWIGRQTVSTLFGPAERLMPVRVHAGALGDGVPKRDLVLTADHALLIDGMLINAGALVNGTTIDYVPLSELGDSYTVYHVETEAHDIILAESAPAETYIDHVARRAFDNYAEYLALYSEDRSIPEMQYPRISAARMLPAAIQARLIGAAAA